MIKGDRSRISYLVVKGEIGPYAAGEHFASDQLAEDQAELYINAGQLVELNPGEDPAEVFAAAQHPKPAAVPEAPVRRDAPAVRPEATPAHEA